VNAEHAEVDLDQDIVIKSVPDAGNEVAQAVEDQENAKDGNEGMSEPEKPDTGISFIQDGKKNYNTCDQQISRDELRPCWDRKNEDKRDRREKQDKGESNEVYGVQECPHGDGYTVSHA
jgi:hypothetical protein